MQLKHTVELHDLHALLLHALQISVVPLLNKKNPFLQERHLLSF
jgi:hypothetical protein